MRIILTQLLLEQELLPKTGMNLKTISQLILQNLIENPDYHKKVVPHLKLEYFEDIGEKIVFDHIQKYNQKYSKIPTLEALFIEIGHDSKISSEQAAEVDKLFEILRKPISEKNDDDWLLDKTEEFCRDRAINIAIMDSISIIEGENKKLGKGAIPELLKNALAVGFDTTLGHDIFENADDRWDYYHKVQERLPFNLSDFNKVTKGGFAKKTLNLLLAGCVEENTKVKVRIRKKNDWEYIEIPIKEIEFLLDEYDVEIDSPDGYQPVGAFVEKGVYVGYECENIKTGKKVIVNENHLFETENGWEFAIDLDRCKILMDSGQFEDCIVRKLDSTYRIVDIQVNHPNHRYYANGFSSHNTHVGKTAMMIHMAAANLTDGKNVVYFSMEMAEEEIAKRIDANLMGIDISDIETISKDVFLKKIYSLKTKHPGKLIVKEFPTGQASINHFRHFVNELKLKRNITPDVIYVDYLNLCNSFRLSSNSSVNTYTVMKAVSEELRGLAMELNVCIVSASQFNRGSASSSDPEMDGISDSFGIVMTADSIFALVATDELKERNQILVKQLKNRYADMNLYPSFLLNFNRAKQKFYDCSDSVEDSGYKVVEDNKFSDKFFKSNGPNFGNLKFS